MVINRYINLRFVLFIHLCSISFLRVQLLESKNSLRPEYMNVGFNEAMEWRSDFTPKQGWNIQFITTNSNLLLLIKLYEKYIIDDFQYSQKPRIPKIIHQMWLSGPVPSEYYEMQETWVKMHPDWQYIVWTGEDIDKFGLINKDKYNAAVAIGTKADIARYEVLYCMGGVHIDMDIECLKPLDVLHHCCDFYACLEPHGPHAYSSGFPIGNAIIGARPGHPVLKKCIDKLAGCDPKAKDQVSIFLNTSVAFFNDCFFEAVDECTNDRTIVFPSTFFYPIAWHERNLSHDEMMKWVRPETFAIHFWFGSWLKK